VLFAMWTCLLPVAESQRLAICLKRSRLTMLCVSSWHSLYLEGRSLTWITLCVHVCVCVCAYITSKIHDAVSMSYGRCCRNNGWQRLVRRQLRLVLYGHN